MLVARRWLLGLAMVTMVVSVQVANARMESDSVHILIDVSVDASNVQAAFVAELSEYFNLSTHVVVNPEKDNGDAAELGLPTDFLGQESRVLVAAGASACRSALSSDVDAEVVCTLLTAQAFRYLTDEARHSDKGPSTRSFGPPHAVVLDQPVSRQLAVSQMVYPALKRFVALLPQDTEEAQFHTQFGDAGFDESNRLTYRRYDSERPLSDQLSSALATADAAIAIPDNQIYNRSTLRTTLLTTYSEGKPVIGFNRAYVRAGALVSAYATHRHMAREVRRLVEAFDTDARADNLIDEPHIQPTTEFSVADNESIARSLGLFRDIDLSPDKDFTDKDFMP